jgi:hypothetical protein
MWVLWKSEYTDRLFEEITRHVDTQRGWMEGILENGKGPIRAFTANNNGIILESLLFKAQGKLLKWGAPRYGLWEQSHPPRAAAACAVGDAASQRGVKC